MVCTSYFSNVKRLAGAYPHMVFVSIAGKTPDWFDGSIIEIKKYKQLAPKYSWWSEWKNRFGESPESEESIKWYSEKYENTVLSKLSPKNVYDDLMSISGKNDVCLLCWEGPDKFCHRHIVGEWLTCNGIRCGEIKK